MFNHVAIVVLSALNLVSAATNFTIDPTEVALTLRATWCVSQINVCDELCTSEETNSCTPETLTYSCVCSDGTVPDVSDYVNSLPYYICEQAQSDCITANENDAQGQANCTKTIGDTCGTLDAANATSADSSSTSTTATATATATGTGGSTAASTAAASSTSAAGAMPTNIQHFGNGAAAIAIGLFAYML